MRVPSWLLNLLHLAVIVAVPIFLVLTAVQLLLFPWFIRYEYIRPGFPPDRHVPAGGYPLEREERQALAERALRSVVGPEGMRLLEEARFEGTGAPAFNAREIRHMADVRRVIRWARVVYGMTLLILIGGTLALAFTPALQHRAAQGLIVGAGLTLALLLTILTLALVNFNLFFTAFHRLFFEGDTWLFRADDTLIRLFPLPFWVDATFFIGGVTGLAALFVLLAAWRWQKRIP